MGRGFSRLRLHALLWAVLILAAALPAAAPPAHATATGDAPMMQALVCAPDPGRFGIRTMCSFGATDNDSTEIAYTVDWGDGSPPERVPATGFIAPMESPLQYPHQNAFHTYATAGTFQVRVTATDAEGNTSAPRPFPVRVIPNAPPTILELTCAPAAAGSRLVQCRMMAGDDGSIYEEGFTYRIDWGDGASNVTSHQSYVDMPPDDYAYASHLYADFGTYNLNVTATDAGPDPQTGPSHWSVITLTPASHANTPPVMAEVACAPVPGTLTHEVECHLRATDDGDVYADGFRYLIAWGDGATSEARHRTFAEDEPPEERAVATHRYAHPGTYAIEARAREAGDEPLTSAVMRVDVTVPNARPTLASFTCTPSPAKVGEVVSCRLVATDDSPGLRFLLDFGDGTALDPMAGNLTLPGAERRVTHLYLKSGTFNLTAHAVDTESPTVKSEPRTVTLRVEPVAGQQPKPGGDGEAEGSLIPGPGLALVAVAVLAAARVARRRR